VQAKFAIKRGQDSCPAMESLCCDSGITRFAKSWIAFCEQFGLHSRSDRETIPHLHPLPFAKGEARTNGRLVRFLVSKMPRGAVRLVDLGGLEMYASRVHSPFVLCALLAGAIMARAEAPGYFVFVSNERSGDVTVIDGSTDAVVASFPVGKRPRGIHATPDGQRVFVTLSGSPRVAPGVDENRAPADKTADGLGVIDPVARKLIDRWHVGSDPEQFAISKDGKFAFIANEDDASALIVDLNSGQPRGKVKVSAEPEGVAVNPTNGEVYVTCEEKGEVFVIDPGQQRVIAKIDTGGRPRSVAFLPDGSRACAACENGGYIAVIDTRSHQVSSKIQLPTGSLPMGTAISKDGKELYVSTGRGNAVAVIDTEKNELVTTIPVGNRAWGIALDPSGLKLYTANGASNDVSIVDLKSRKELRRIKVGDGPWGTAIVTAAK
jgi:YVTN family beta-propeller protein